MDYLKNQVRRVMRQVAHTLNKLSNGSITPDHVTLIGLVAHLPIALLIVTNQLVLAGLLLIVFGLFDTLDGELARLQKSTSARGMFLDSVADRMKEFVIYIGLSAWLLQTQADPAALVLLVGALGVSLMISYLNAWGEAVLARHSSKPDTKLNKAFRGGLMGFEVRMTLIIIGLLSGQVILAITIILLLGTLTLGQRTTSVLKVLKNV